MSQTGNYKIESERINLQRVYDEAVIKAKDAAVTFGLDSWQYQRAINEMQIIYRNTPKPFSYKVINLLNRIKWLLMKR